MRPLRVTRLSYAGRHQLTICSVLSVQGKKVLHIDRNDHYGGYVMLGSPPVTGTMLTSPANLLR